MKARSASLLLAAILVAGACSRPTDTSSKAPPSPPVPVSVATAVKVDAPILIRTIGTVESKAYVMMRPQTAGQVAELAATEGSDVAAGQVLLKLDARPFEAALRESQARLDRSRALADDAHKSVERIRTAGTSMARRDLEAAEAQAAAAEAQALGDQAAVDNARLNLDYCIIKAPFAGRLGQYLVKPGSIVKANEADLVDVAQIDPIDVAFAITEEDIPATRGAAAAGPLRVEVLPSGDTAEPVVGTLTFIDNKIDAATGTIRLKATFENKTNRLWPGRFTTVSLVLGQEAGCVMVPDSAVQPSQQGPSVFVVKADNTVEFRPVAVRRTVDGRSVIGAGISEGEIIVTDGQLRLGPGATVQVKLQANPKVEMPQGTKG